jgi:hypothetical protein
MTHPSLERLQRKIRRAERGRLREDPAIYQGQPVLYAERFLKLHPGLWDAQKSILEAVHRPPYKVLVRSAHNVGKTFAMAVLTCYWFDCFQESSAAITTAPTSRDVKDLLWTEIRILRKAAGLGGFRGHAVPELYDSPDHFAKGFTAEYGESFQGRHRRYMLFIFDEAIGVPGVFWTTTKSMFQPDGLHAWVVIGNPTDTSSQMYAEEQSGEWNVIEMSAFDHPNIIAELNGEKPIYPSAVTLAQLEGWLRDWGTQISPQDAVPSDLRWPPARPCPVCREGIQLVV